VRRLRLHGYVYMPGLNAVSWLGIMSRQLVRPVSLKEGGGVSDLRSSIRHHAKCADVLPTQDTSTTLFDHCDPKTPAPFSCLLTTGLVVSLPVTITQTALSSCLLAACGEAVCPIHRCVPRRTSPNMRGCFVRIHVRPRRDARNGNGVLGNFLSLFVSSATTSSFTPPRCFALVWRHPPACSRLRVQCAHARQ